MGRTFRYIYIYATINGTLMGTYESNGVCLTNYSKKLV